jgi:hypothetical protein
MQSTEAFYLSSLPRTSMRIIQRLPRRDGSILDSKGQCFSAWKSPEKSVPKGWRVALASASWRRLPELYFRPSLLSAAKEDEENIFARHRDNSEWIMVATLSSTTNC